MVLLCMSHPCVP
ncbi:hypothetical protein RDI58_011454 [Solanum bulbocastanum]|uniref:Uncharacterized protein n=1 Tax=Solanum bulbocastanum TaxID=147425 RepID=A0AAN8YKH6_SOLBU